MVPAAGNKKQTTTAPTFPKVAVLLLQKEKQPPAVVPLMQQQQQQFLSPTALYYRGLRDTDDESVLQDMKIRTPFFFDPKKALEQPTTTTTSKSGINVPLLRALYLNQALNIGLGMIISAAILINMVGMSALGNLNDILRWTGTGPGIFDLAPTPERLLYGLLGAVPLILFSNWIERSDKRAFSNVNLSTITLTLTLFGRRNAPPEQFLPANLKGGAFPTTSTLDVFVQSLLLASVVGLSEESVFRRLVPAELALYVGMDHVFANLVGAAFAFAAGHLQPKSGLGENGVTFGLQFINGLGFGLIYVLSGGDLVPCIVAHALYDFVAFFKTWVDANDQIEYAESMFLQPLDPQVEQEARKILRQIGPKNPNAFDAIKMLFYTFDFDKNGSLSLSEVRKGISYHAINQGKKAPPQEWIDRLFREAVGSTTSNRMTFPDFLRLTLLSTEEAKAAAAKRMAYS